MAARIAMTVAFFALLVGGAAYLHYLSSQVKQVVEQTRIMSNIIQNPQYVIFGPCEPDNRMVVVGRHPQMQAERFVLHAYRLSEKAALESPDGSAILLEDKTTIWVSNGVTIEVVTPRYEGEGESEWCDRHDKLVELMMERFPQ